MAESLRRKYRVWAEIDLDRLVENYQTAKRCSQSGRLMPVVKANAYGHGAVCCALTLRKAGADFFAVSTPEEAFQLRRHGIDCELLLLGVAPVSQVPALVKADVTLCAPDFETARAYAEVCRPTRVHVKIDTGLNRLGFDCRDCVKDILRIACEMNVTGLFTHFAAADIPSEDAFTREQFTMFEQISSALAEEGFTPSMRHAANSAALLAYPDTHLDITRPGLMLYGYSPFQEDATTALNPVLSMYTSIQQCRAVPAGQTVNYGRAWTAQRDSIVAVVPVGYADILSWGLLASSHAFMRVRGRKALLVGRVCMDFCILDVTDIPGAAQGDVVTILDDVLTVAEQARILRVPSWEILFSIGRRVPRIYRPSGRIVKEETDLDLL